MRPKFFRRKDAEAFDPIFSVFHGIGAHFCSCDVQELETESLNRNSSLQKAFLLEFKRHRRIFFADFCFEMFEKNSCLSLSPFQVPLFRQLNVHIWMESLNLCANSLRKLVSSIGVKDKTFLRIAEIPFADLKVVGSLCHFFQMKEIRISNFEFPNVMNLDRVYPKIRDPRKTAMLAIQKASPRDLAIVLFVWSPTQEIFEFCLKEYEAECQKQWDSFSKTFGSFSELLSDTVQGLSSKHPKLGRVLDLLNCLGTILIVSSYPELSRETASLRDKERLFWSIKLPTDYAEYIFPVSSKKSLINFCVEREAKFWFAFLYKTAVSSRVRWLCELKNNEFIYFAALLSSVQEINGQYEGQTPLMSAVALSDHAKINVLCSFHACKNLNHPECETNAMGRVKDKETFLFLLQKEFCPDLVGNSGSTLLSRLCSDKETPKELLRDVIKHSNPNVPQKVLPLVWALFHGDEELLELLFENGADPLYAERTADLKTENSETWKEARKYWDIWITSLKGSTSKIAKSRISLFVHTLQVRDEKCLWWLVKHSGSVSVEEAVRKREVERPILDVEGRDIQMSQYSDKQILWFPTEEGKKLGLLSSLIQEFVDKESKKPNPRYDRIDFFASKGLVVCVPLSEAIKLL
ncbi:ankyrin repeat-containing protein [Brazilian marseillevirus]|uniref:ankyrin repeat-containing protein n=1 Tax=Brazilian marseillevirus TaxID=1813599 RepID=UPI0007812A4F|nr:ankyrin repeat-containing protein [Brazilian marseillevirus]AMQ10898.1 ankyrin repeat-containing protein [Brazilian marseillevirus]